MNQRRARLVQILFEAIIPVAGYFFWNWDVSFILLFYLLDWMLFLSLTIAKARKRLSYSGQEPEKRTAIKWIAVGVLACSATCMVLFITLPNLIADFSWKTRFFAFLTYADMGIQQGFVLIPLMALNGYLLYKQQFLMPARYRTVDMEHITRPATTQGLILLLGSVILYALSLFVSYPTELIISLVVIGTGVYRWQMTRKA